VIRSDALVVGPRFRARHALLEALGVTISEHPLGIGWQVQADATGQTAAPGVWVAGNVADVTAGVMQSAASGVTAGVAINADLTAEDTDRAVAAARGSGSIKAGIGEEPHSRVADEAPGAWVPWVRRVPVDRRRRYVGRGRDMI